MNAAIIWKYKLQPAITEHNIPFGAKILSVQIQGGDLCIWVLVKPCYDTQQRIITERRTFIVHGTGYDIPGIDSKTHLGTVQQGAFVWHIFEVKL